MTQDVEYRALSIAEEIDRQGDLVDVLKATVLEGGSQVDPSNISDPEDRRAAYIAGGLIEPPYDPRLLVNLFEMSSTLRPNVDAFITNIDAFGHTFQPVFDFDAPETRERISDAMYIDRIRAAELDPSLPVAKAPTDKEVDRKIEEIRMEMKVELAKIRSLFESCVIGGSFVGLRRKTRQDIEILGNAFWEAIRDKTRTLRVFNYVPAFTVVVCRLGQPVSIQIRIPLSDLTYETMTVQHRFRLFVQLVTESHTRVWFKEFGDPRLVSSRSGRIYETIEDMRTSEGDDVPPATELIHFRLHSTRTPYGIPRWIGALLAVLGNRQAEEVNFLFFESKSIPPLAILVSGGRLASTAVDKLKDFVKEEIKGKKNFHKILIIEGEPANKHTEGAGRFKIELKPLTQAIQQDALFQKYDERNADKIGEQFRIPRMLRGDIRDFNRATADAALSFAEMQVFQPERENFDGTMNRTVLGDLRVRFWKFMSQAPINRDPVAMANMVRDLVKVGVLLVDEGRALAADIFNREFKRLDAAWTQKPMQVILAETNAKAKGIEPDQSGEKPGKPSANGIQKIAKQFVELNRWLDEYAGSAEYLESKREIEKRETEKSDGEDGEGETITLHVPREKLLEWLMPA